MFKIELDLYVYTPYETKHVTEMKPVTKNLTTNITILFKDSYRKPTPLTALDIN